MEPTLIGYFPKERTGRPAWLKAENVAEIGSVSSCIAAAPDDWIAHWTHNALWLYDSPEAAWAIVPAAACGDYDLYAYRLYPISFVDGQETPFPLPALYAKPFDGGFERLGFDVVSRSAGTNFECSPLSCNGLAEEVAVNRFCLLDTLAEALALAAQVEGMGAEPGPYHVVEVYRQQRAAADSRPS